MKKILLVALLGFFGVMIAKNMFDDEVMKETAERLLLKTEDERCIEIAQRLVKAIKSIIELAKENKVTYAEVANELDLPMYLADAFRCPDNDQFHAVLNKDITQEESVQARAILLAKILRKDLK